MQSKHVLDKPEQTNSGSYKNHSYCLHVKSGIVGRKHLLTHEVQYFHNPNTYVRSAHMKTRNVGLNNTLSPLAGKSRRHSKSSNIMVNYSIMKKARIIHGAIWASIALATSIGVCVSWHNQGCGVESLIAAVVMYTACSFGIWYTGDAAIQGK